jgi:hypothetical protein
LPELVPFVGPANSGSDVQVFRVIGCKITPAAEQIIRSLSFGLAEMIPALADLSPTANPLDAMVGLRRKLMLSLSCCQLPGRSDPGSHTVSQDGLQKCDDNFRAEPDTRIATILIFA